MKIKPILLLVLAGVLMAGCPRTPPPPRPIARLSETFKAFTVFKTGTYWVYKDSLTGDMDSIHIYTSQDIEVTYDDAYHCDSEDRGCRSYSSFYPSDTVYNYQYVQCDGRQYSNFSDITTFFLYGQSTYDETQYPNPSEQPGDSFSYITHTKYVAHWDSLRIDSAYYNDVRLYAVKNAQIFWHVPAYSYWAKNIGLVKKVMPDGHIWELQKYHVVQ